MITPVKVLIPKYKQFELNLLKVIFKKFDLDFEKLKLVKPADTEILKIEFDYFFMGKKGLKYLGPNEAKTKFIERFYQLKK